jgi:hypothetical protein
VKDDSNGDERVGVSLAYASKPVAASRMLALSEAALAVRGAPSPEVVGHGASRDRTVVVALMLHWWTHCVVMVSVT